MTKFTLAGIAFVGLAVSLAGQAHGSDTLPLRPVPLASGTVALPVGPGPWAKRGAWIDEQTVASVFSNFGVLAIHRVDGTILQTFENPDSTSRTTVGLWDTPIFVDNVLLVKSKGTDGQQWQHLHFYSRSKVDGTFSFNTTIDLTGVPSDATNGKSYPMTVESTSGGLESRRIVIAWNDGNTGHVRVLVPTGPGLTYAIQSLQYTGTFSGSAPKAYVRGNLMVVRPAPLDDYLRFFRLSGGQWISDGVWEAGAAQMSEPALISDSAVFVGDPTYGSRGRVLELHKVGNAWVPVSTLAPQTITSYSAWGSALTALDNWLFIARKQSTPGAATVESFRRANDGTLTRGATYAEPTTTNTFQTVTLTANGMLVLDTVHSNEPWSYALVASALDLDADGAPDGVAIESGAVADCNVNCVPDAADVALGIEADADRNGVPDACVQDCDDDGTADYGALLAGAPDCNHNYIPDSCDLAQSNADVNNDGNLDACDRDCNLNGTPDSVELQMGTLEDCDGNGIADTCDRYQPIAPAGNSFPVNYASGSILWFPVDPAHPIVCGIDMQYTQSNPQLTTSLAIIADPAGSGHPGAVTASQVLWFETLSPTVHEPVEMQGGMTINRYRFAPVNLSGMGGFWVRFSKSVRQYDIPVPTTTTTPGHLRNAGNPATLDAASIANNLHGSVHQAVHAIEAWPLPLSCGGACDLNYDGVVDGADLGMLLATWGGTWSAADFDRNGTIDGGDLGMLLGAWGVGR